MWEQCVERTFRGQESGEEALTSECSSQVTGWSRLLSDQQSSLPWMNPYSQAPFEAFLCDVVPLPPTPRSQGEWPTLEKVLARATSHSPIPAAGLGEWGLNSLDLDGRKGVMRTTVDFVQII